MLHDLIEVPLHQFGWLLFSLKHVHQHVNTSSKSVVIYFGNKPVVADRFAYLFASFRFEVTDVPLSEAFRLEDVN